MSMRELALPDGRASDTKLFRGPVEDGVDYVKRDHAPTDDGARSHGPPKHVRPGKIPDGEQAGYDRYQDAGARSPKRNLCDYARIEETSSQFLLAIVHVRCIDVQCTVTGVINRSARTSPN